MTYTPRPVDTGTVELPDSLKALVEQLAENAHDAWAKMRIEDGWRYGPQRDDSAKTHPDLVPYDELPASEQRYDRELAVSTLKVVLGMGYSITGP
jgi:hypothetical protein